MELRGQPYGPAIEDFEAGQAPGRGARRRDQPDRHVDRLWPERGTHRPVSRASPRRVLPGLEVRLPAAGAVRRPAAVPARLQSRQRPDRRRAEPAQAATPTGSTSCRCTCPPAGPRWRPTTPSRRCRRCATRARSASSGCQASCPTCPTTSRWASSRFSRSRTRRCSASTRTSSRPRPAAGAGTLIRGGAARGAPAEDKDWRRGPLGLAEGEGQRRWEASGVDDLLDGMTPTRVRAPLHAQPSGPVEHDRRHVQRRPPAGRT